MSCTKGNGSKAKCKYNSGIDRESHTGTDKKIFLPCIMNNEASKKKRKEFHTLPQGKIKKMFTYSPVCRSEKSSSLSDRISVSGSRLCDGKQIIHHMTYFFWVSWCWCCGFPFWARMFQINVTFSSIRPSLTVQKNSYKILFALLYTQYWVDVQSLSLIQVIFHLQHH